MSDSDRDKIPPLKFDTPPEELLSNCTCCPRDCRVDRTKAASGFCSSDANFAVSSICSHHGEEPVLSGRTGICNIFFTHCNMQCIFCQNYQISDNRSGQAADYVDLDDIVLRVETILAGGAKGVGFVSPSHFIPQMRQIMLALQHRGHTPTFVYNSNGYDRAEMIETMEADIDVYLPDMKYMDNNLPMDTPTLPTMLSLLPALLRKCTGKKEPTLSSTKMGV